MKPSCLPLEIVFEQGEVLIEGVGGPAVSLTPEAAIETSSRLLSVASQALAIRRRDAQVQVQVQVQDALRETRRKTRKV